MPEQRSLPLVRWGEDLRRGRTARRAGRRRLVAAAAAAAVSTLVSTILLRPPRPLLVWNASASSPVGLYGIRPPPRDIAVGDVVVAWPPDDARRLAAERHYLPFDVPLVKRVGAVAGDRVCAVGEGVYVNGSLDALRRAADSAGRPLPSWTGCEQLRRGELLLLSRAPDSFDGRYFGPSAPRDVIGKGRLLWPR